MRRRQRQAALYRNPHLGLLLLSVVLVWSIALPMVGAVIAWMFDGVSEVDAMRRSLANTWTAGVVYGVLTWLAWILFSLRPRVLGLVILVAVGMLATGVLETHSQRPPIQLLADVVGILLASATANFIVGLPSWSFRRQRPSELANDSGPRRQFSISNLMLITTIVALMIVLAKQVSLKTAPSLYWWVAVVAWGGLSVTSSLLYLACLRRDGLGRFLFSAIAIACGGLLLAGLAAADVLAGNPASPGVLAAHYGVLIGAHTMTSAVFATATCIESMRA